VVEHIHRGSRRLECQRPPNATLWVPPAPTKAQRAPLRDWRCRWEERRLSETAEAKTERGAAGTVALAVTLAEAGAPPGAPL
jgi:hypothetical protein